jgi:hypothetical protein
MIAPQGATGQRRVVRVAWTNITITGGPAADSEGATQWLDYERLRAEETKGRGGVEEMWMEERRRCAAAKRERAARGQEKMARREAAYAAERAVQEERGARFQATHKRLREEPGPRGTEPLVAHAGGVMTTNKEEALRKFAARKGGAAGERAREACRQLEERREEGKKAKKARVEAPEQTEGRLPLSAGNKRKAEAPVLNVGGESDEVSGTDAGQTEAKRRRGGE